MSKAGWGGIVMILLAVACNGNASVQTKAHILERKVLANGRLLVNYVFKAPKGLMVKDSVEVDSKKIIPHDSVPLIFSAKDPHRNQLEVP
jgi:hypothetical protein